MNRLGEWIMGSFRRACLVAVALGLLGAALSYGAVALWGKLPGSATHKLPEVQAQLATTEDKLTVATTQGSLNEDLAGATIRSNQMTSEENARATTYITRIQAPSCDGVCRSRAALEFVCGNHLYAADPACHPEGGTPSGH